MSPPQIAVLLKSDSFIDIWPRLVGSLKATLLTTESVMELRRMSDLSGIVVSAAGAESETLLLLQQLRVEDGPPIAVVGAEMDHRLAVTMVQRGASNYFALPSEFGALRSWLVERVERAALFLDAQALAADQRKRFDFSQLIGRSLCLERALDRAAKVIPRASAAVLLTGETGTGKELLARAIHYNGPRATEPFVEINCSALPANLLEAELFGFEAGAFTDARMSKPGLLEVANGGTLFLDEIGDMSLDLQSKLLRVLEAKRVRRLGSLKDVDLDLRIVAATHVDLPLAVEEGRFRQDLYYRLNVIQIRLPALRDRGDDVTLIAKHFLDLFSRDYDIPRPRFTEEIEAALLGHAWPGNVRELKNAIERAVLLGDGALNVEDLFPDDATPQPTSKSRIPFPAPLHVMERAAARAMVEECGGNKSRAAAALGVSRKHLYALLKEPV